MLPRDTFENIVRHTPLVSIDLLVTNPRGEILVGLRRNRPAQDTWFVPGGRILKNETIEQAFRRISKAEMNLEMDFTAAQFRGVFQHRYDENVFGQGSFGTHYIVLTFQVRLDTDMVFSPVDLQHREFRWMAVSDLLADPTVHPYVRFYFLPENIDRQGEVFASC